MSSEADEVLPSELDNTLHSPKRLAILAILYRVELAEFKYLERRLELTDDDLSRQLRILKQAGLVELTKRGRTAAALTDEGRATFEEYRAKIKHLLRDE